MECARIFGSRVSNNLILKIIFNCIFETLTLFQNIDNSQCQIYYLRQFYVYTNTVYERSCFYDCIGYTLN
jgi:hypothetical protein